MMQKTAWREDIIIIRRHIGQEEIYKKFQ